MSGSDGGLTVALNTTDKTKPSTSLDLRPEDTIATLNIAINSKDGNEISKCKDLLSFLTDKVLPKTLSLISVKCRKKETNKIRGKSLGLFSCVRSKR